ncbi:Actin-binding LIM protein 3 [Homalodisca vitripennis]|nr:Actin-binding LIM protein 3 [Homalodisca vitripennis]
MASAVWPRSDREWHGAEWLSGAIWHPRCGPGPTENGTVLNGSVNGHTTDTDGEGKDVRDFDRMSSSAVSEMQTLLTASPRSARFSAKVRFSVLNLNFYGSNMDFLFISSQA